MALKKKPITLKNPVNPLDWNVPMVNPNGTPTAEFQRKWLQQAGANSSIVNVTTAAGVSAVLDILSSVVGSLLVRGATVWQGLGPAGNGRVLRDHGAGATPTWDTLSTILDLFSSVQGAVLYRDAAAWNALAPGGAGQVLTSGGPAANPAWSTSSSGGGAASIQDDGTTVFVALSDTDGQLVLDGSGDPIFSPEVFPVSAMPALPSAQIIVGSAGNVATPRAMSGDATISNTGVVAVGNGGAWVPADVSGDGIAIVFTSPSFYKIGQIVYVAFTAAWPANAGASQVKISLPVPTTHANAQVIFNLSGAPAVSNSAFLVPGALLATLNGGGGVTNAALSGVTLNFNGVYQTQ